MSTPGRPLSPRVFRVGDYGHRPFRRRSMSQWSPGDQSFDEAAGVTRPAGGIRLYMGAWAGADRLQLLGGPARSGMSARLRLLRERLDRPVPHSVHLVDEEAGDTFCGAIDPVLLTRLDRPWQEWSTLHRCADCDALSP